jgi:hypothetical protein
MSDTDHIAAMEELPNVAFTVPPQNQGQIVQVSYGCTPDYIFKRSLDKSDRTVIVRAYHHPDGDEEFEPWNDIPCVGKFISVVYYGPSYLEPAKVEQT